MASTSRVRILKSFSNFHMRIFSGDNPNDFSSYKANFRPFGCLAHFCALVARAMGVPKNDAKITSNWINIDGLRVIIKSKKVAIPHILIFKIRSKHHVTLQKHSMDRYECVEHQKTFICVPKYFQKNFRDH